MIVRKRRLFIMSTMPSQLTTGLQLPSGHVRRRRCKLDASGLAGVQHVINADLNAVSDEEGAGALGEVREVRARAPLQLRVELPVLGLEGILHRGRRPGPVDDGAHA